MKSILILRYYLRRYSTIIGTIDEKILSSRISLFGEAGHLRIPTADHSGYKFIAYVLTILPHILSLQNNS